MATSTAQIAFPLPAPAVARARTLETERAFSAGPDEARVRSVMTAHGATLADVAATMGVSRTRAAAVLTTHPASLVPFLPVVAQRAYHAAALAELDDDRVSVVPAEARAMRVVGAAADLTSRVASDLSDGVLDDGERRALLPMVGAVERECVALRRAIAVKGGSR